MHCISFVLVLPRYAASFGKKLCFRHQSRENEALKHVEFSRSHMPRHRGYQSIARDVVGSALIPPGCVPKPFPSTTAKRTGNIGSGQTPSYWNKRRTNPYG